METLFECVRQGIQAGREAANELAVRCDEIPSLDAHDPFGAALEALAEIVAGQANALDEAARNVSDANDALLRNAEPGSSDLTAVAGTEIVSPVSPLGDASALGTTPVDVGWSDSLHTNIVSVESNDDATGGNA